MIRFENIVWQAGAFRLGPVSFEVPSGTYGVLMGRTGCGKTTLAEILCGLRTPTSGKVWLADTDVTFNDPALRGIGYVPQDGALFPTMNVRENLAFALRLRGQSRRQSDMEVERLAHLLHLAALLERRPEHLSGGERQRVSLGRALVSKPNALLLDEPLSALDEETHAELVQLLKEVQRTLSITVLHITHNRQEAAQLADRLFRIENGAVEEMRASP